MSSFGNVLKNIISLFTSQIAVSILSFISSIIIARFLGDVIFGKYSFIIAFVSFFTLFSDIGYNTLIVRDISKDKNKATTYIGNVLTIRLLACVLLFFLMVFSVNILEYQNEIKIAIYLFGLAGLISSVSDIFLMGFRAFEKMQYETITTISLYLTRTLSIFVLLNIGYGLTELALLFVITSLFDFIFKYVIFRNKITEPTIKFCMSFFLKTIKIAVPLGSLSFLGLLNTKIDTVMLSYMIGDAAVGWYNAAYNLTLGLKPIPKLIMFAIFPIMSAYSMSSYSSIATICKKTSYYFFMIGLPLAIGTTLLSDKLILFIYGNDFLYSISALKILSWDLFLQFLIVPLNITLVSINHEKKMNVVFGFAVFVNIVLNLFMIPLYSYVGAAITTIISETILFGLYFYVISKEINESPLNKNIIVPIIGSSLMSLLILYCRWMNLFLIIPLSIILYFAVIWILHGFPKEDIDMFKDSVSKMLKI